MSRRSSLLPFAITLASALAGCTVIFPNATVSNQVDVTANTAVSGQVNASSNVAATGNVAVNLPSPQAPAPAVAPPSAAPEPPAAAPSGTGGFVTPTPPTSPPLRFEAEDFRFTLPERFGKTTKNIPVHAAAKLHAIFEEEASVSMMTIGVLTIPDLGALGPGIMTTQAGAEVVDTSRLKDALALRYFDHGDVVVKPEAWQGARGNSEYGAPFTISGLPGALGAQVEYAVNGEQSLIHTAGVAKGSKYYMLFMVATTARFPTALEALPHWRRAIDTFQVEGTPGWTTAP